MDKFNFSFADFRHDSAIQANLIALAAPKVQLSIFNFQLSTLNFQLSIFNSQLSTFNLYSLAYCRATFSSLNRVTTLSRNRAAGSLAWRAQRRPLTKSSMSA